MVNDFYYNDGKAITSEEAHALTDKSLLIVADREVLKAECDEIKARNIIMETPIEKVEEPIEPIEEPTEEVLPEEPTIPAE